MTSEDGLTWLRGAVGGRAPDGRADGAEDAGTGPGGAGDGDGGAGGGRPLLHGEHLDDDPAPWRPRTAPPAAGGTRRLVRIVGVAWLAVAVLAGALVAPRHLDAEPAGSGGPPAGTPGGDALADAGAPGGAGTDAAASSPEGTGRAAERAGGAGLPAPDDALERREQAVRALAALAVRVEATSAGPPERYVDAAHAEALAWHGDVAVVTVTALVLEGADGSWTGARPARFGVAVAVGADAPALLAAPWPLPAPSLAVPAAPQAEPVEPEDAAALATALEEAGYGRVAVTGAVPVAAGLRAVTSLAAAPGDAEAREHVVWVTGGPDPRVLGHGGGSAPRPDGPQTPSPAGDRPADDRPPGDRGDETT